MTVNKKAIVYLTALLIWVVGFYVFWDNIFMLRLSFFLLVLAAMIFAFTWVECKGRDGLCWRYVDKLEKEKKAKAAAGEPPAPVVEKAKKK